MEENIIVIFFISLVIVLVVFSDFMLKWWTPLLKYALVLVYPNNTTNYTKFIYSLILFSIQFFTFLSSVAFHFLNLLHCIRFCHKYGTLFTIQVGSEGQL